MHKNSVTEKYNRFLRLPEDIRQKLYFLYKTTPMTINAICQNMTKQTNITVRAEWLSAAAHVEGIRRDREHLKQSFSWRHEQGTTRD